MVVESKVWVLQPNPETVIVWLEVKDEDGNYVDPGTSIKCTIYDPNETVVAGHDGQAMTKSETGKYYYDYNPSGSEVEGYYEARCEVVDSGRTTTESAQFFIRS